MELRADLAQGFENLGREHDDGEAMKQRNVAENEAHTDLDGDEGHRQRRQELEHAARQERDAKRGHCGLRIRGTQSVQVRARCLFAAEAAERGQARHEVEELGGQALHRRELVLRGCLRKTPDENHEDRDQRDNEEGDESGPEVEQKNDAEGRRGHRAHEDKLGQEGDEVGAQILEPGRQQGRRLCALGRPPTRPQRDARIDDASAQLPDRGGGRTSAHRLTGGDDQRAAGEHGRNTHNEGPDVGQGRGARHDGGEGCGNEKRLGENQQRGQRPQEGRHSDGAAR